MKHHERREALGAYALGSLEPAERAVVEAHLESCPGCRDELAALAAIPGLLSRLSSEEASGGLVPAADAPLVNAIQIVGRQRRRTRRRLWVWRAAAGIAAAVIALLLLPLPDRGAPGASFTARPAASDAAVIEGTAYVESRPWGMVVEVDLRSLPDRRGFVLWAVDAEGHRAQAGSWRATEDGAVRITGSCYMALEDIERLEVTAPEDELILTFEPA